MGFQVSEFPCIGNAQNFLHITADLLQWCMPCPLVCAYRPTEGNTVTRAVSYCINLIVFPSRLCFYPLRIFWRMNLWVSAGCADWLARRRNI